MRFSETNSSKVLSYITLSWRRSISYRNHVKLMKWFLYDRDLRHEKVKWKKVFQNWPNKICGIQSSKKFLNYIFQKFYLVHPWILRFKYLWSTSIGFMLKNYWNCQVFKDVLKSWLNVLFPNRKFYFFNFL